MGTRGRADSVVTTMSTTTRPETSELPIVDDPGGVVQQEAIHAPSALSRRVLLGAILGASAAGAVGLSWARSGGSTASQGSVVLNASTEVPRIGTSVPSLPPTTVATEALAPIVGPLPGLREVIDRVVAMPQDADLLLRASSYGLDIVNVAWEDTGRDIGSSLGPNISDVTLQVREPLAYEQFQTHLLPVLRYPNYADLTGDVAMDKIWVNIGNQSATSSVTAVPLREVLRDLRAYLSNPAELNSDGNFLDTRDSHVLASAQHVFVPLPKTGAIEFNPVIYNYSSSANNPAVMTLLVTRQGTSVVAIENYSGDQSYQTWGQQLFFNNAGQRTALRAERQSAVVDRAESGGATSNDKGALAKGADMVMLIQVPIMHTAPPQPDYLQQPAAAGSVDEAAADTTAGAGPELERSDIESAVVSKGSDLGPYVETKGLKLVRDPQFPIRVTVQFYKATSNGIVDDADLKAMKAEIDKVYNDADFVGSLVVPPGQQTRPTAWKQAQTRR